MIETDCFQNADLKNWSRRSNGSGNIDNSQVMKGNKKSLIDPLTTYEHIEIEINKNTISSCKICNIRPKYNKIITKSFYNKTKTIKQIRGTKFQYKFHPSNQNSNLKLNNQKDYLQEGKGAFSIIPSRVSYTNLLSTRNLK